MSSFLEGDAARDLAGQYGTPLYVYSRDVLRAQATQMLHVPAPFGLTIRYAMKANPHPEILATLRSSGVMIDASSEHEVQVALDAGYLPREILLTSQQSAVGLKELVKKGVAYNATSLRQLESYGKLFPGTEASVRLNPGIGSGHSVKTNVGGRTSSFGIWHEYIPKIHELCKTHQLKITRVHTHIGSGTDPAVWQEAIRVSLELFKNFPDATVLNLGGGFKVGRMPEERGADMDEIGQALARELSTFADETGRKLHLELEPGTFMVANAGVLLASVDDVVDTGEEGYTFLKLNTGMNDIMRPSLYGAQHPITVLSESNDQQEYIVVGHNCESGDLLTPAPGDPEVLRPRLLPKAAVGDIVLVGGAGAYCASMAAHGYNSYPDAKEVLI
jgi:diaminopimelate decarboxylase